MSVKYTADQQRVIDTKKKNILVSAAAGSGKTAVLVERIIRRITDRENPLDIDRLLVVTFTNSAAAGMRERIGQAIERELSLYPNDMHLQRQAVLVHQALITTVHSFCLYLVRNHFEAIGLEPDFTVAEEATIKLLSKEVKENLLERYFAEEDPDFQYMVEYLCHTGRETVLEDYIDKLYERAMSMPFPEEWLLERKGDYDFASLDEFTNRPAGQFLLSHIRGLLHSYAESYRAAYKAAMEPDGPYMYADTLEAELEFTERLCRLESLKELGQYLPAMEFKRLSTKKDTSVDPVKREQVKNRRNGIKANIQKLGKDFFGKSPQSMEVENAGAKRALDMLVQVTLEYMADLAAAKRERGYIDYHDMEHMALQILMKSDGQGGFKVTEVAESYRARFEEVMVDEYQDSNLVQEYLVAAVSRVDDRFMVGDVKQSIYKFRLARPELFMEKYQSYAAEDETHVRIDLKQNFRSRRQVLDAVNSVFSRVMTSESGGIVYDESAALYPGAEYPENASRENDVTGSEDNLNLAEGYDRYVCECVLSCGELPQGFDAKRLEAYSAAQKIKALLKDGRVSTDDRSGLRPVAYDDIVLLFRSPSLYEEAYREVFDREHIPLQVVSGSGYFDAKEVQNLVKLLECVENPLSDIPLYGVCISLFGGLTEEELARVQIYENESQRHGGISACIQPENDAPGEAGAENESQKLTEDMAAHAALEGKSIEGEKNKKGTGLIKEVTLWEKLGSFAAAYPQDPTAMKIVSLRAAILKYRRQAEYCSVEELLRTILNDFHYREQMRLLPDGEKRAANVELLLERAAQFSARGQRSLFAFVQYIRELHRQEIDYGEASVMGDHGAVRVMSIHKSKGLEFPIVIVGGIGHSYSMQDRQQLLLIDNDLGLGADYVSPMGRSKNKTLQKNVISLKMERDILAEEQRIFYVAMTRAKESLILCGYKKNAEEFSQTAARRADGTCLLSDILSARSYLDLLLLSYEEDTPIVYELFSAEDLAQTEITESVSRAERREKLEALLSTETGEEKSDILKENPALQYEYPYQLLTEINGKTSVSELKLAAMEEELGGVEEMFETERVVPCVPEFLKESKGLGGAAVGTAYHRVLELADFTALPASLDEWQHFMDEMAKKGRLTEKQRDCVSPQKLDHFGQSTLAHRMAEAAKAGTLRKEQAFFLGVPVSEVGKADFKKLAESSQSEVNVSISSRPDNIRAGQDSGEEKTNGTGQVMKTDMQDELVLIQGIIDAFFEEEDGIVLLDYKTDRVAAGQELVDKYHTQMQYYTRAIEQALAKKVKEVMLYSFYLEEEVPVTAAPAF
ncbi:MAG: UvrD-helicase domain-containing protein [Lachnospiraceae bacterium]|nr:UvrD-helicase domain-containing protein [Lachnospiraceae bacterium]